MKQVTLAYCVDNLTRKSDDAQLRNELNEMRMEEKGEKGFEIIRKDFDDVVKKFDSKSTKSYDFLLKAGVRYQNAIFKLCKRMVEQEEFPVSFRKTLFYMIWKQKGPAEVLKK